MKKYMNKWYEMHSWKIPNNQNILNKSNEKVKTQYYQW